MNDSDSDVSPDTSKKDDSFEVSPGFEEQGAFLEKVESKISSEIGKVLDVFEKKLAYDSSKQLQVDRLHEELQKHKGDYLLLATRPLVLQIIQLYGDIGKLLSALRKKSDDEMPLEKFLILLEGLQDDVEVLLSQNGVASYRGLSSSAFNPQCQRALQKVETDDPLQADKIAETLSPGFEQGSSILEKEKVVIYKFTQEPGPKEELRCSEADIPLVKED